MPHPLATDAPAAAAQSGRPSRKSRSSSAPGAAAPGRSRPATRPPGASAVAAVCRRRCAPTRGSPARSHAARTTQATVQRSIAGARRGHPQEQCPALAPRAAAKIGHHRLAHIDRQRQHVLPVALAAQPAARLGASRRRPGASRRPPRRAAPAATTATGSRNRAGRPAGADRSWPAACGPRRAQDRAADCDHADRRPTEPPTPTAPRSAPPRAGSAATTATRTPGPAPRTRCASGIHPLETSSPAPHRADPGQARAGPGQVRAGPPRPSGTAARPAHTHRTV